jgi:uncharacterized membrane protein/protein-disulfide isomerase
LVIYNDSNRLQRSWPLWRWILTGLNILALVLSLILSWHYLKGGSMVGCGGGSPCEQVLNSQWSTIAGIIPVSGLAVGVYLALLFAGFFIGPATEAPIRRMAWSVMLILAGSVAGSAIWFTILQKWFIGHFCPYCMTTHITGLLLAILIIWRAIKEISKQSNDIVPTNQTKNKNVYKATPKHIIRSAGVVRLALIGLVLPGLMAVCQINFTPSPLYSVGKSQEKLPAIDYNFAPLVGSPDAPYVVTLLFDYQCPHCQKLHFILNELIRRYDGKLAFALCPAPLNTECNPYIPHDTDAFKNSCELARIGMAVWVASREAFPVFENWMFTFESGDSWQPRRLETARAKAVELVGQEKFEAALADPWIGKYIQTCILIYGRTIQNGKGGVPKLIFGSHWVIPELYNADNLVMILQKSLAVPKP